MRFQLPGSSSSIDHAVIESAERGEGALVQGRDEIGEEPLSKRVKITVRDQSYNSKPDAEYLPPETRTIEEKGITIPAKLAQNTNDPEAWVNRIMHPWLNNTICCPEMWNDCTGTNGGQRKSGEGFSQDQATMATGSFDSTGSSKANDASSVTPIMPPFPTSTYESQYDGDNDDDDEEEAEEEGQNDHDGELGIRSVDETGPAVLGIVDRNKVAQDEGVVILEETSERKRVRQSPASVHSRPPPRDTWFDGDDHVALPPQKPVKSSWRKRAWIPPEAIDPSPLDEEFDIESYPDYEYKPRSPRRLVEI